MNQDKLKCKNESLLITQEMDNLGFTINETKSVLIPTQFFGVIIDTKRGWSVPRAPVDSSSKYHQCKNNIEYHFV
jgi:hypothetical protein